MTFERPGERYDAERGRPTGRLVRRHIRREVDISGHLAAGTLACPACDAPVAPPAVALGPADELDCGWCGHGAPVREFLSLAAPPRPTRVDVRVVRSRP